MEKNEEVKRQGELLFIPVTDMPEWAKKKMLLRPNLGNVIREGEVTGHKHEIVGGGVLVEKGTLDYVFENGESYHLPEGQMFLTTDNEVVVKHPEHKDLKLKGNFIVRIQREYDEVRDRYIMD